MYCVFIFNRANASERRCTIMRKTCHMQKCTWKDVLDVLFFIFRPAKASERLCTMIGKISHAEMHMKRHLQCTVFLYSAGPMSLNASGQWLNVHVTRSSMYCVFIFNRANTSERQCTMIRKNITYRNTHETRSSRYCVFMFRPANASERLCTMIRQKYNMQKCTWNDAFEVLCFCIQAGQRQWTPVHND